MSSTIYYDDLIRDYLLFRGFTATLKAFEAELKVDKDKGFRMSGESSITVEEQSDWVEGNEGIFQEGSDKEPEFFDQNDINMLYEAEANEAEDNDTRSEPSGAANSHSSETREQSSDSEESVVDELDSSMYSSYHNKYVSYEDLEEDAENGENGKAEIVESGEILRAVLSESQQIQDVLRDFASSVNARLEALENSFHTIRNDIKRSLNVNAQDNSSLMVTTQRKSDPASSSLADPISPRSDPLSQNPDPVSQKLELITQKSSPASKQLEFTLQKPNPVSLSSKSISPLPETVLPLSSPVSVRADPVLLFSSPNSNATAKKQVNRDPRLAKPKTSLPVFNSQGQTVASEPNAKDAPTDSGASSGVAMSSLSKQNIAPVNSGASMSNANLDVSNVMKSRLQNPSQVFESTKTVGLAKQANNNFLVVPSGKSTIPTLNKAKMVQKAVSKTINVPLTANQTTTAGKRPIEDEISKVNKRSTEATLKAPSTKEKSGISSPQPGGSGVTVPLQSATGKSASLLPKPIFTSRQTSDSKSMAGSSHMQNNAATAQVFQQLLHMQRIQLQNDARNAQAGGHGPSAKIQPIPRYIPAWFARSLQEQARRAVPMGIQPTGQQQRLQLGNRQLTALQAQLASLQAQTQSMAQRTSSLPVPQQRAHMTQLGGGGQPQRDMGRTQQQSAPLMGFRLQQSQQVVMGRPIDYSRVDKVVDQLCSYIASYDLASLRDAWSHLDQRVFSRLEHQFVPTVRKLEGGLLKMYVMNTIQTNRSDKLLEFFEKMSLDLQNQPDWKEWFVLPFVKNPEENPVFSMFFTRQWQDTMLVSLHNFLSVIFQSMPLPTLLSYGEEQAKMAHLMDENEVLKQKLAFWQSKGGVTETPGIYAEVDNVESEANELMDDFCVIAQQEPAPADSQQSKSIRSLIRNISSGLPTSPILGRKQQQQLTLHPGSRSVTEDSSTAAGKYVIHRNKPRTSSSPLPARTRILSENEATSRSGSAVHSAGKDEFQQAGGQKAKTEPAQKPRPRSATIAKGKSEFGSESASVKLAEGSKFNVPFLLLSQDEYREHHSTITHCKFNAPGSVIASSDVNGVVKIWMPNPSPQTIATVMSKSGVLALEWASKLERLLLIGNRNATIRLYDIKDKKTLCEIGLEQSSSYREQRVTCLACSPIESTFICCSMGIPKVPFALGSESAASAFSTEGRISIWDMKLMKFKKALNLEPSAALANCCVFNHNGQLLLVGAADGRIRLFDMRCDEGIATWQGHRGNAYSVQFSTDETSCYSLGEDGKFIQWSVNKTGEKMSSSTLHEKAAGPFGVYHGCSGNPVTHNPVGKLFASDAEGRHILTCSPNGGMIYSIRSEEEPQPVMSLGGHNSSVVTVDWASVMDCGTCITASLDGEIKISTLLAK